MKKIKLLLAAMAAMVGLSAQAGEGWTNQSSYSTEWATPTSGQTYYIYNVGAGTFLGGGRGWGTRTISTSDRFWVDGDAVITPTENVDYALPFTLQQNSDGTWYLIHNGTNKANKYMFYEPEGNASYIDNNYKEIKMAAAEEDPKKVLFALKAGTTKLVSASLVSNQKIAKGAVDTVFVI